MVRLRVGMIAAVACVLSGCAQSEPLADTTWQVSHVYSATDVPAGVPDEVAGAVALSLGRSTVAGFTGCAPLQAQAVYTKDDKPVILEAATEMTITHAEFDLEQVAGCSGKPKFIHDALTSILTSGPLSIEHVNAKEIVLRESSPSAVEPRAIRLVQP
ncbi:hypothetical protein P4N68_09050 [Corynebacterium felinum]|uniref:GerMN domain-containing protein n=2 Tax=Corynebacterium felinum TaxID=131318 RepID=A0ABU2B592_9CORY|nr:MULTISPECIES: hypothetical protein [Corynebacterium]MDF5821221.1 hypothetical protein [Corynebacterium felinum]MDO4761025.1 hypothetical protein [Corynebacterium sp.]MDR7353778.1 hypothetical protein [Corynebacterium felinum]WJY95957.1 hypothetical protein CFELI_11880 [Corynebacterium felinum]